MNAKRKRAKLRRLYVEQGGRCKWCGKQVRLHGQAERFRRNGATLSAKAATVDHLYHWSDRRRHEPGGETAVVMACDTCNRRRGQEDLSTATLRNRAWPVLSAVAPDCVATAA